MVQIARTVKYTFSQNRVSVVAALASKFTVLGVGVGVAAIGALFYAPLRCPICEVQTRTGGSKGDVILVPACLVWVVGVALVGTDADTDPMAERSVLVPERTYESAVLYAS